MKFNELNLTSNLMKGIEEAGFTDCTPVQEQTFKLVLDEGRDATVQSQTGTGKTAAFLISIFEIFERENNASTKKHAALVVVPTRELAVQVADEAKVLGKYLPYQIGSVFGGVGYGQQERLIEQGAEIIIGTPGRLLDFSSSRKLDLRGFDFLVLDEADRMLDMGFLPDMRKILRAVPPVTERHTLLFSATLSTRVKHLAWEHMNEPGEIEVAPEQVTVDEITQELYHVTRAEKLKLLLGLLEREKPETALIFTNMKSTAVELSKRLSVNGYECEYIMGDLPQSQRQRLIDGIKEGRIKLLVATDVAARGLHIDDLDLVVNYDIPEDYELYVHRIGRTARAGKSGKAITLACERYVYGLEAIESFIGQKIPVVWPEEGLYKEDASAGMRMGDRRERGSSARSGRRSDGPRSRTSRSGSGRAPSSRQGSGRSEGAGTSGDKAGSGGPKAARPAERSGGRPRSEQGGRPKRQPVASNGADTSTPKGKPSADAPIEDRLSYYRQKYGEDFQLDGASEGGQRASSSNRSRGKGGGRSTGSGRSQSSSGRSSADKGPSGGAQSNKPSAGKQPATGSAPKRTTNAPKRANNGPTRAANGPKRQQQGQPPKPSTQKTPPVSTTPPAENPGLVNKLKRLFKRR